MAGVSTIKRGGSRLYVDPDDGTVKVPGVTSIVGMAPKDFLTFWNAKLVAEKAVDELDLVRTIMERDRQAAVDYLKGAPRRYTAQAADVGSAAHDAFERLARGESVNERHESMDIRPHLRWFREWLDDAQPEFLYMEETVWSDSHLYAGSFDAIARVDGHVDLIDYKTSKSVYDSVSLQLSAYQYADRIILADGGESIDVPEIDRGMVLHVRPEGWEYVPLDCGEDVYAAFLALRDVWEWENTGKKGVVGRPVMSGGPRLTGTERRAA